MQEQCYCDIQNTTQCLLFLPLFTVNQHAISSLHADLHVNKVIQMFMCLGNNVGSQLVKIPTFSINLQHVKYIVGGTAGSPDKHL